jgi:hypothetical protein
MFSKMTRAVESPKRWTGTHRMIHGGSGRENIVMLTSSGAAFTRGDWAVRKSTRNSAQYKFLGFWVYRNEPFKGTVVAL